MSNEPKYSSREERDRAKREQRKQSGKVSRAEYARQNSQWLEEKSREEGVLSLPMGIYYKVLAEGNQSGDTPLERSASALPSGGCSNAPGTAGRCSSDCRSGNGRAACGHR